MVANTRIPYASTLQLEEVIKGYGMTPVSTVNLQMEQMMIPAAGNPALPPQSTSDASLMKPLHVQSAEVSKTGYPVRGEKEW